MNFSQSVTVVPISRRCPAASIKYTDETHDFVLRPLDLSDAKNVFDAVEISLPALKEFLPFAHLPHTFESQLTRIKRARSEYLEGKDFSMGLFCNKTEKFICSAGLHPILKYNPNALDLSYWVKSEFTSKGFATLASKILIYYAFRFLECQRLQISHDENNILSAKVVQKCGFEKEGKLRGYILPLPTRAYEDGYIASGSQIIYSLIASDLQQLPWYHSLANCLSFYDMLGNPHPH